MTPPPLPGALPPAPSPDELDSPAGQLLERSAAATALADLDGRITYVNAAFLALWGFAEAREVAAAGLASSGPTPRPPARWCARCGRSRSGRAS